MHIAAGMLLCLLVGSGQNDVVLNRPVPELVSAKQLKALLQSELSGTWQGSSLGAILDRIGRSRKIAILLDCRIDPTSTFDVNLDNHTLREGLEKIAASASTKVSVAGNTVYIGPARSTAKLRTLIRLRLDELGARLKKQSATRRVQLRRRRTFHWNDLDRPAELVQQIATRYKLKVKEIERVPHDLWVTATLPEVSVIEALSLVLIQSDLTFQWNDTATEISIVPVPQKVAIIKRHALRGRKFADVVERLKKDVPGVTARVIGRKVAVTGSVEQHEAVAALLNPRIHRTPRPKSKQPAGLARQPFSLKLRRIPARDVIKGFRQQGIVIAYDAEALQKAGIDLEKPITLEVKSLAGEKFFSAVFGPLGLKCTIEGNTVTLKPK